MAVVLGADVAVDLGAPNRLGPDGAAAGVLEGAAEAVAPPREGKRDDLVVLVDVGGWLVAVPRAGAAGFAAESVPVAGGLKRDDV